ncbi:MAG: hypothetical protein KGJ60_00710 [Verrucomicrobiota bacterium]|nr:hypothetical protein [Verrucomicrobiota bacterium]
MIQLFFTNSFPGGCLTARFNSRLNSATLTAELGKDWTHYVHGSLTIARFCLLYEKQRKCEFPMLEISCNSVNGCYTAHVLQGGNGHFNQFSKSAIGSLLIALILMLDAMAACLALHELIHKGAENPGHRCAVTLLAQGKVSLAVCEITIPPPQFVAETTRPFVIFPFSPAIENLPQGRAPPAPSAVS